MISYDGVTFLDSDISWQAREWRNCEEIFKYCRQHTLIDETSHKKWMEKISSDESIKMFGINAETDDYLDFKKISGGICQRDIGVCGLTNIDYIARHAEFSLYISPGYQGKKYAKSALYNLLKHGFYSFNLNKIWGEVFDTNLKALHIFENVFMMEKRKGHRQHYFKDGKYLDTWIVDITRDEFDYHHRNGIRAGNEDINPMTMQSR